MGEVVPNPFVTACIMCRVCGTALRRGPGCPQDPSICVGGLIGSSTCITQFTRVVVLTTFVVLWLLPAPYAATNTRAARSDDHEISFALL